jgi:hypothetical protein
MNISVEYKDIAGTISTQTHTLTRLAFAKHLAIAGQGYAPKPQKLIRTIAMFHHYIYYLQRKAFYSNKFSQPLKNFLTLLKKDSFQILQVKQLLTFFQRE